jgi:hypothetical protein
MLAPFASAFSGKSKSSQQASAANMDLCHSPTSDRRASGHVRDASDHVRDARDHVRDVRGHVRVRARRTLELATTGQVRTVWRFTQAEGHTAFSAKDPGPPGSGSPLIPNKLI